MSTSPFASLENATLTFKSSAQAMEVDEWGNRLPVQEDLVIRCWLKEDGRIGQQTYPGISESDQAVRGFCIDPQFLPDSVTHLSEAIAVISGQTGRFILYRGLDGLATSVTGTALTGLFRRSV